MRIWAFVVPLLLCACSTPSLETASADVALIARVVDTFALSIKTKNRDVYLKLFVSQNADEVGWQAVVDDSLLAKIRQERPEAIKARRRPDNNFVALIDGVIANPAQSEERISNLSIKTDGEIGSVHFDYEYVTGNRVTNWGQENWQLVRTETGWKIFSVVYTIREPAR